MSLRRSAVDVLEAMQVLEDELRMRSNGHDDASILADAVKELREIAEDGAPAGHVRLLLLSKEKNAAAMVYHIAARDGPAWQERTVCLVASHEEGDHLVEMLNERAESYSSSWANQGLRDKIDPAGTLETHYRVARPIALYLIAPDM